MTVHRFKASLDVSHRYADAPWWELVYREAFPGFAGMTDLRSDGWWQRAGIDRLLTFADSTTLRVDEKVREKDWGDILLERWSDRDKRTPGWVQKPLACDFIAYAVVPTQTVYMLPFKPLRRAWKHYGPLWIDLAERGGPGYTLIEAQNRNYVTESIGVPVDVLFRALSEALTVVCPSIEFASERQAA